MDASGSNEPAWLSKKLVLAVHAETLQQFGGTTGLRDEGRLESALSRPQNRYAFADPSLFELAAAYCHGIVRNHPFVDGNKRTGLLAARAFLFRNGHRLDPDEAEMVRVVERVASGEVSEEELAQWIEQNIVPR
ncbi:MAG: type II toxin-antitoxin system death-on-curing family toxin [Salinibacter sp.]